MVDDSHTSVGPILSWLRKPLSTQHCHHCIAIFSNPDYHILKIVDDESLSFGRENDACHLKDTATPLGRHVSLHTSFTVPCEASTWPNNCPHHNRDGVMLFFAVSVCAWQHPKSINVLSNFHISTEFHSPPSLSPNDSGGERVDYRPRHSTVQLFIVAECAFIFQEAYCYLRVPNLVARVERVAVSANVEFQKWLYSIGSMNISVRKRYWIQSNCCGGKLCLFLLGVAYIVELVEVWRPSSFMQLSKEDGVYKRTLQ